MELREGGLDDPAVRALVAHHTAEARGSTPADNAHAMDADALKRPDIGFWTIWEEDDLLGFGALRHLSPEEGDLKSMRTAPHALSRGVGRAMLDHLIGLARTRGYVRLRLETGTAPMFDAANRMYETAGFVDGEAYGGYPASPHNRFMVLDL